MSLFSHNLVLTVKLHVHGLLHSQTQSLSLFSITNYYCHILLSHIFIIKYNL